MTLDRSELTKIVVSVRLQLIHQATGSAPVPADAAVWRTCLRDVAFLPETADAADRAVRDEDAYALLLEIVCGLRSPILGETEVQAQFKTFLSSLAPQRYASLLRLGQQVLADAKLIRQRHLQGFGSRSYAALATRYIPQDRRVAIIGTGALASQLCAALSANVRIDQWGRRAEALPQNGRLLSSAAGAGGSIPEPTSFVIAAPASAQDLIAVAGCYSDMHEIIDLRGSDQRSPLPFGRSLVTLDDLFVAAAADARPSAALDAARHDIRRLARAFAERSSLRPFGWDDLCT